MVFNKSEEQEKKYLQKLLGIIRDSIDHVGSTVKRQEENLREQKDYLWQNIKEIDAQEVRSMRETILNTLAVGESIIAKRKRLTKLLDIPYFGRIDFKEHFAGSKTNPVYIGVHTYYDPQQKVNLIYDWRAPVASMFYDHELGKASYKSPTGEITGEISLKRQYRIRKGIMEFMIESSITVHDEILQKELSSNANDKMKNIVATIQREQNRIIRNEQSSVLIIQGVAGSGKTSIALHRVAYLLYAHKGELSSADMLIISPNKVFADYISNVLPELGENTVPEIRMEQILSGLLNHKYKYQTFFEQVGELLATPTSDLIERIRFKATFGFIARLDRFILHIENTYFRPVDVKLTKYITVPGEFIGEQFRKLHRYPVRQRLDVTANYIVDAMKLQYGIILGTPERNLLKKEIHRMFAGNNDIQVYKAFYEWIKMPRMLKIRRNRTLEYADLAPLVYLHFALDGSKPDMQVKHLLIDEMQDYTPIQYKILMKLYPCRKTVLGDAGQSVNPYGSSTADMIRKVFVTGDIMQLCKSYRSTFEITDFAQKIRKNDNLEVVERHGPPPLIKGYKNKEEELKGIAQLIAGYKKSGQKSIAIICKTETQAEVLHRELSKYEHGIFFLSQTSGIFVKGMIVTSAHMAKGLEFDQVIIPHADDKNYSSEIDRSMLYVAVTRAMHQLTVTYYGNVTGLVTKK